MFLHVLSVNKGLEIDNKSNVNNTYGHLSNTNKEALIHSHSKFILKIFQQKVNEESQGPPSNLLDS